MFLPRFVWLGVIYLQRIFSSPVRIYRKSNCTPPGFGVGGGDCIGVGVSIMFIFALQYLCDGQHAVGRVILFAVRSSCVFCYTRNVMLSKLFFFQLNKPNHKLNASRCDVTNLEYYITDIYIKTYPDKFNVL